MEIKWKKTNQKKGILVAFNEALQPLILWWYQSLRKYSSLPIAFIDFGGLSKNLIKWCKDRGYYYNCEKYVKCFKNTKISKNFKKKWPHISKEVLCSIRPYWFSKPIAMMHTPFEKTLYLDIDCEVKDNIDELFTYLNKNEIAICKDVVECVYLNKNDELNEIVFNSGVIVYDNKSKIIKKWTNLSFTYHDNFFTDQDLLSHIIYKYKYKPTILPNIWNCHVIFKDIKNIKILHWQENGKAELFKKIQSDFSMMKQLKKLLLN